MSFGREVFEKIGLLNEKLGFANGGTTYIQGAEPEFAFTDEKHRNAILTREIENFIHDYPLYTLYTVYTVNRYTLIITNNMALTFWGIYPKMIEREESGGRS